MTNNCRRHRETYYLDKRTIIRVFKEFKRNPYKVFVATDLFRGNTVIGTRKYLKLLLTLGIIKEVKVIFMNQRKRTARGYKLISNQQDKKELDNLVEEFCEETNKILIEKTKEKEE